MAMMVVERPRKRKRGVSFARGGRQVRARPRARRGRRARVNGELKFHELAIDDALVATAGTITPSINIIPQGVDENERIGRKLTIVKILWRIRVVLEATTVAAETSDQVRLIVFLDKQANGAPATVTDILQSANVQAFNNLSNKGRFRTLMDREYAVVIKCGGTSAAGVHQFGEDVIVDSWFKDVNIPIEYSGTTGVIAQIRSNNIGVLAISHGGFASIGSQIRVRFSDQ